MVPLEQWIASHLDEPNDAILIIVRDDLTYCLIIPRNLVQADMSKSGLFIIHKMVENENNFSGIHRRYIRVYANIYKLPVWASSQLLALTVGRDSELLPLDS